MTSISTYSLNTILVDSAKQTQSTLATALIQQSSGLAAETYGGLGDQAGRVISLATEISRAQSWGDNAELAGNRVQTMYDAVGGMVDKITSLRSALSAAMSDTDSDSLTSNAEGILADLAELMNTQSEGRYLFAGSDTDTAPVDVGDAPYTAPADPTVADTTYYQGDDAEASVQVSRNETIAYGVTADNTAFEQALRAARIAATATTDPVDTTTLQQAYDAATSAMDALLSVQGQLSVDANRLDSAQQTQTNFISYAQDTVDNIKNVDVSVVAAQVSQRQTLLDASYSAIAKVQSMNLAKYL